MKIKKAKSRQPLPKNAKKVFDGVIFDVYQWEQELYDGSVATFEKVVRLDTVLVIAVTTEGKIILIKQEQPGKAPIVSLPGGRVDDGEEIIDAAKRELLEETGYATENYELFDSVQPVSKIEWGLYTFIAKGCKKVTVPDPGPGEKIELMFVEFDEFLDIILSDEFQDSEIMNELFNRRVLEYKWNAEKLERFKSDLMKKTDE